ncbi:MAG TPA: hypothetical protein VHU18_02080 [Rhizomicrobium sp.]|jgi:hypothetical protein|nr:hypothetical protein [Rhizomicrobium sp.]
MQSLITTAVLIIGAILVYRYRRPLVAALQRFDARNRERIEEEISDRRDPVAHYRHTLRLAGEQVEDVGEIVVPDGHTGAPVSRYLFEGEQYASRDEAEAARQRSIVAKARQYYVELPAALAHRRKETLN